MFAKIFGQIFDSSIAEDYNCRRMFMDLLVLADSDGVVDMTYEAISRRTNVPIEEVRKYISELLLPDPTSRSKAEEGKRLIPVDTNRDWGWQIVNYEHYRRIRDEEVRRSYFREAQRKYRAKSKRVKDKVLTVIDINGQVLTPASPSSSTSSSDWIEELKKDAAYKGVDVQREYDKAIRWAKENRTGMTRRRFVNWLNRADKRLDGTNNGHTTESGRGIGTANEGKSAQYAGVGKVSRLPIA